MTAVYAIDAQLLCGTAGSTAATEMSNVSDVRVEVEADEIDVTTRASQGWKATAIGLLDGTLVFDMLYDNIDPDFTAIRTAYFARTPLALFVTDGAGNGLDADWNIMQLIEDQPVKDVIRVSVKAKPAPTRVPAWVTRVTGGTTHE